MLSEITLAAASADPKRQLSAPAELSFEPITVTSST
jgi:hypothetical protein